MHSCIHRFITCLLTLAAFSLSTGSNSARAVTWQILPFPDNNWGGSHGQPASTNDNIIALYGQPVRSVETFSGPLKISYDVSLDSRAKTDGGLQFYFVPTGLSSNLLYPCLQLYYGYRNTPGGSDALLINTVSSDGKGTQVWGEVPINIVAQTTNHHIIEVSATGELTWIVNDLTNSIPGTVAVPFGEFQLELQGWQPGGPTWTVSNFAVVPEPSTALLMITGLLSLAFVNRSRRPQ